MRKFFYTLGIIAASALAFSACQKEQEIKEEPQSGKLVTISFTAEKAGMETRTGIATEGDSQVSYKWTDEDASNIKLFTVDGSTLTQVANPTITKVSDDKLTISATVAANATYTFRAILAGAWTSSGKNPKLSDSQSPNGITSFDPTADILVSDDKEVTVSEDATNMLLTFYRKVVINKMTLKKLTGGEKVDKVVISADDYLTGYLDGDSMSGQKYSITVDFDNVTVPSDGLFPVYFVTIPKTGQSLTVEVTTDKGVYTKSFAEGKTIDFNLGQFTKFNFAVDKRSAVTLTFENESVSKTTANYSDFTGQIANSEPSVNGITYEMTGDAIGSIVAETGIVTLNGTAGTATVTASFAGNDSYLPASSTYTIVVSDDEGPVYSKVTSLGDVVAGTYVIVNDGYYLPNAAATSAAPVKNDDTKVIVSEDHLVGVTDDMTWDFSGSNTGMTIKSTISGNYYLVVSGSGNNNVRVNTTAGKWTISEYAGTSGAFTLKDNSNNRYCATYSAGSDWRSYTTFNAGNYGDGGKVYLYKLEDNRPTVAAPSFSPAGGEVEANTTVTLSCETEGATIYYTTDGTEPTTSSNQGTSVTVTSAMTIKAIAVKDGYKDSDVASASYSIEVINTSTEANPYTATEADALAGQLAVDGTLEDVYVSGIISQITTAFNSQYENVSFNISADGLTTSTQFTIFRAPATSAEDFKVGDAVEFKGTLKNYQGTTHELEAGATLIAQLHAPSFSPDGGTFTNSQSVTISAGSGSTIYYSTDGSDPTTAYSSAITLTETSTIKAKATKGVLTTGVVSATFTKSEGVESTTYQHVFTAKPSTGNNVTLSEVKWNIEATNLNGYNSQNYAGVQIGSSKSNGSITLTSSSNWSYEGKTRIKEVRLWLNLGGTSVTPTVTIGGKSAISDGTTVVKNSTAGSDWTKTSKVTFTPATDGDSGVVVINVATVKAGYICAIEIDCE